MDLYLQGKVVLVTGGASGIGAMIARLFAEEGCTVCLGDINFDASRSVQEDLEREGYRVDVIEINVADACHVQKQVATLINRYRTLDILVNSAGVLKTGSVIDASFEDWDEVCRVNLSGVYYCTKAVMPHMVKKRYGRIINIASVSGFKGGGAVGNTLYGVTKAGVIAMTKGLARELAPYGIRVNAVAPSLTETPMTRAQLSGADKELFLSAFPMKRLATTRDIALATVFLASDLADYITGVTLPVDGGYLTQ